MNKMTTLAKVCILALVVGVCFFVNRTLGITDKLASLLPGHKIMSSLVPSKADLPTVTPTASDGTPVDLNNMTAEELPTSNDEVRMNVWAWNAQMGLMLANGGKQTTKGSLMDSNGVRLNLIRQDDSGKMQENLLAFANDLHNGNPNPTSGVQFVVIMGDGSATFLKGLNDQLRRLGPEYQAEVVGSTGYSRGEDKFMGPATWKADPHSAMGGFVSGVLRDGDWNIAQKWLSDNGLKNNPDEKTYDPDALNWVNASDYVDAASKYVAGYSEDRPVVRNGKPTGEKKHLTIQGVVTWTPGDVTVAKKKGGVVSIVSTREYASQMPSSIIGIRKWDQGNKGKVTGMLAAIFDGANAIKSSESALQKAGEISNTVYAEAGTDANYWVKYYKGSDEQDAQGLNLHLGGSSVSNLADNMILFGMVPGSQNLYAATYKVFGDIVSQQYPNLVPTYYPADQVINTQYIAALAHKQSPTMQQASVAQAKPTYSSASSPVTSIVSKKSWSIQFATGRASFSGSAQSTLHKLLNELLVASGAEVEIHGHTDNVGSPDGNMKLSESRAFAVASWLRNAAPVNFPEGRLRVFSHGQENPLAPNDSEADRAKNRRVDIIIGTTTH